MKLSVVLESYKHFHKIEVHKGCFITIENIVLVCDFVLLIEMKFL